MQNFKISIFFILIIITSFTPAIGMRVCGEHRSAQKEYRQWEQAAKKNNVHEIKMLAIATSLPRAKESTPIFNYLSKKEQTMYDHLVTIFSAGPAALITEYRKSTTFLEHKIIEPKAFTFLNMRPVIAKPLHTFLSFKQVVKRSYIDNYASVLEQNERKNPRLTPLHPLGYRQLPINNLAPAPWINDKKVGEIQLCYKHTIITSIEKLLACKQPGKIRILHSV